MKKDNKYKEYEVEGHIPLPEYFPEISEKEETLFT